MHGTGETCILSRFTVGLAVTANPYDFPTIARTRRRFLILFCGHAAKSSPKACFPTLPNYAFLRSMRNIRCFGYNYPVRQSISVDLRLK
jgi:hypothetical protein